MSSQFIKLGTGYTSISLSGLSNGDEIVCIVSEDSIITSNTIVIWKPDTLEISIVEIAQNHYECSYKDADAIYEWRYWKGDYPIYGQSYKVIAGGLGVWMCRKTLYAGESYKNEPNYPAMWKDCIEVVVTTINKFCNNSASASFCINPFS